MPLFVQTEAADGAAGSLASRPTVVLGAHRQSDAGSTRKERHAHYHLVAFRHASCIHEGIHECKIDGHTRNTHSQWKYNHSNGQNHVLDDEWYLGVTQVTVNEAEAWCQACGAVYLEMRDPEDVAAVSLAIDLLVRAVFAQWPSA